MEVYDPVLKEIPYEEQTLLGAPEGNAVEGYRAVVNHPDATLEECQILGNAIVRGVDTSAQLTENTNLSPGERTSLGNTVEDGLHARKVLLSLHLRVVIKAALTASFNETKGRHDLEEWADLIGIGNLALVNAVSKYKPVTGKHFAGYAKICVKNAFFLNQLDEVRDSSGRSVGMQRDWIAINKTQRDAVKDGEEISLRQAAIRLGIDPKRLDLIMDLVDVETVPIDKVKIQAHGSPLTVENTTEDSSATAELEKAEDRVMLKHVWDTVAKLEMLHVLTPREIIILHKRFKGGVSQQDIGTAVGLTQASVKDIEFAVLAKIRNEIEQPGYYEQPDEISFGDITDSVVFLRKLGIPITKDTNALQIAKGIIEADTAGLTELQRTILHTLIGTEGKHLTPAQLAEKRGCTHTSINATRRKAIQNIIEARKAIPDTPKLAPEAHKHSAEVKKRAPTRQLKPFRPLIDEDKVIWMSPTSNGSPQLSHIEAHGSILEVLDTNTVTNYAGQRVVLGHKDKMALLLTAIGCTPKNLELYGIGREDFYKLLARLGTADNPQGRIKTTTLTCKQLLDPINPPHWFNGKVPDLSWISSGQGMANVGTLAAAYTLEDMQPKEAASLMTLLAYADDRLP